MQRVLDKDQRRALPLLPQTKGDEFVYFGRRQPSRMRVHEQDAGRGRHHQLLAGTQRHTGNQIVPDAGICMPGGSSARDSRKTRRLFSAFLKYMTG